MSLYEWLLFFHVLAAFLLVTGVVVYGVLLVSSGGDAAARALGPPALALWNVGGLGVLVFGVWLALEVDGYELWDGWIIAAIVLWAIAGFFGQRTGVEYTRGVTKAIELRDAGRAGPDTGLLALNRTQRGLVLHAVVTVTVLLILIDMIWKPGA
jgi:hypothetical protein